MDFDIKPTRLIAAREKALRMKSLVLATALLVTTAVPTISCASGSQANLESGCDGTETCVPKLPGVDERTRGGVMKINQAGLGLIKQFAGLRLSAYYNVVGILTIGYGHTGPDVKPGLTITEAKADELLNSDLARFESGVGDLVKVPLSANQFSALVSFSWDQGLRTLRSSTLLRLLNQGDYRGAAQQFRSWDKAGGQERKTLLMRRDAERALFETPAPA
ncbi:lysozyme [Burkholderia lata]|nr:lysozyme [Burkholderia lata]